MATRTQPGLTPQEPELPPETTEDEAPWRRRLANLSSHISTGAAAGVNTAKSAISRLTGQVIWLRVFDLNAVLNHIQNRCNGPDLPLLALRSLRPAAPGRRCLTGSRNPVFAEKAPEDNK